MTHFVLLILVCLSAVPPDACTEDTALDVIQRPVDGDLACFGQAIGGQAQVADGAFGIERGEAYVKTVCRRVKS